MTGLENVVLGVVSGVLTSAFLYLGALLVQRHLLPWYRDITYKGVDVSGVWQAELKNEDGLKARFEMQLRQRAHEVSGLTTIVQGKDLDKPAIINTLTLSGNVWEGFITLNLKSADRKRLSFATTLLEVTRGGATLQGKFLWRSIQTDDIRSAEIAWRRKR